MLNIDLADKKSIRAWAKNKPLKSLEFSTQFLNVLLTQVSEPGQIWGAFSSLGSEPKIDWAGVSKQGLRFAFPKIESTDDKKEIINFYIADHFETSDWGILEPVGGKLVQPNELSGLLLPGMAFDNRGTRLGRGKAFYDDYLNSNSNDFKGLKVGLTFSDFYILGPMKKERWDVAMDYIVTEKFIFKPFVER